jgi:hypothetical protein
VLLTFGVASVASKKTSTVLKRPCIFTDPLLSKYKSKAQVKLIDAVPCFRFEVAIIGFDDHIGDRFITDPSLEYFPITAWIIFP